MSVSRTLLVRIFISALLVRWAYAFGVYAVMGDPGLMGTDSISFYAIAKNFALELRRGDVSGWHWLSADLQLMPFYSWLLTLCVLLAGAYGSIAYVLIQGLFDSGTCVLIYLTAAAIAERYALPAAIFAIINPTQIVVSGLIYHDTPFVFFAALFLLASVLWLRKPSWTLAFVIGLALGGGALFRILVGLWLPVQFGLLLIGALVLGNLRWRTVGQIASAAAIACLLILPVFLRNGLQYGAWMLTAQGGTHLAIWVVPLVQEAKDGTLWEKTAADIQHRAAERFGPPPANPFEASRQLEIVGREALRELGVLAVARAWLNGAAVNLGSPAVVLSPPIASLPRTGFYGTPGASFPEKVFNFLFHSDNARYAQWLLAGIIGVVAMRLIQLIGLWTALRAGADRIGLALLAVWVCYILAVSGPVGSPKYRLPIEPPLMVLAGAGWHGLRTIRRPPGA
ncbi:MAG: hypothetical protein GHHEDOFH_01245 [Pseudorhodoplanes sp.]|nr:hypothetical protein [Pseudorhodoplanes sp.]